MWSTIVKLVNDLTLACAFRFRGGGFVATGSDTLVRAVWSAAFALAVALGSLAAGTFTIYALPVAFITAWLSVIIIDHSMAMNVGRWAYLQCRWYTRWLVYMPFFPKWGQLAPPTTGDQALRVCPWGTATVFQKTLFDFLQLSVVGALRGLIIFVPLAITNAIAAGGFVNAFSNMFFAFVASGVLAVLEPLSYFTGWYVPLAIPNVAAAKSTDWGELFCGVATGVALGIFQ